MNNRARVGFCWLFAGLLCVLAGCGSPREDRVLLAGQTMGTTWSVQMQSMPEQTSREELFKDISITLDNINAAMSTYQSDSELVTFNNHANTDWFPVSPAVAKVVAEALAVSQLSNGAFDVTVSPLVDLWGFGATGTRTTVPTADEIASTQARTGYKHLQVRLQPPALRKSIPRLSVDLSAIAKGYAVDALATLLEQRGSRNYLVEIGGELRGRGQSSQGTHWSIGIVRPDPMRRQVEYELPLCDKAVATSGDYLNYFETDGHRYSHAIDPRTGAPVDHHLASVTVLADSAMAADALATALLVLGPQAGLALAEHQDAAALLVMRVSDEFTSIMSPAWQRYIRDTTAITDCGSATTP